MLNRFRASAYKDLLILSRDKAGLAILFFMPVILIFIMTVIQDSAYNTMGQNSLPLAFVDNDNDSLGLSIYRGLDEHPMTALVTEENGVPLTAETAKKAVSEGHYLLAIIVPEGTSAAIRGSVSNNIDRVLGEEPSSDTEQNAEIIIFVDPAAQQAFVSTVTATIREFISEMKTHLIFETFAEQLGDLLPDGPGETKFSDKEVVTYRQEYAMQDSHTVFPSSVQHNVPAWTIFAMFFIIIPLSVSLIREKDEGTMIRLRTLPGSYADVLAGKFAVFFIVCNIQFVLMLLVGILVLPLVGLPVLNLGGNLLAVAVVGVAVAFAATSAGLFVGTICTTHQQASIGGSVAVLILAAIGGIWVPTYVMPKIMETVSNISPLNWGLNAFYNIFLRGAGVPDILLDSGKLVLFGGAMMAASYFYQKLNKV